MAVQHQFLATGQKGKTTINLVKKEKAMAQAAGGQHSACDVQTVQKAFQEKNTSW